MALFRWAAPIYDLTMNLVGHGSTLDKLVKRIEPEPGESLLDLGGGTGQLLDFLPPNMKVTLVDSSENMLAQARKKESNQKVKYVRARGDDMPLADNSCDYVVIADALHHFSRVEETIEEVKRVLKPKGEIYILEFHPGSMLTKFISAGESIAGEPANFYLPEELSSLFYESGFTVRREDISNSIYIIQAEIAET